VVAVEANHMRRFASDFESELLDVEECRFCKSCA
jgi:hypothetical protein